MGFLSRKSRPEDEPQVEGQESPDSAVETIEPTPEEGGEIKISKAGEESVPEPEQGGDHPSADPEQGGPLPSTDPQQGTDHRDTPGSEAEEVSRIDSEAPE